MSTADRYIVGEGYSDHHIPMRLVPSLRESESDKHSADADEEPDAIVQTLDLLCPDAPVAVSALHLNGKMEYAYFDRHLEAAAWVRRLPAVKAVYVVMNPHTKVSTGAGITASDITHCRWFLIDCDPKREKRTNATDWELGLARDIAAKIKAYLTSLGWPLPIEGDSGNGAHLLYAIDLPNDAASTKLLNDILKHLERFNTPGVEVDQTTGDPNQITKLYGTMARKGPATDERPHRPSALTSIPAMLAVVPLAALHAVCPPTEETPGAGPKAKGLYDLDTILIIIRAKLKVFGKPVKRDGYTEYQIKCPWDAEHSDPGSKHGTIFTWSDDGAPGFTCPHDSCIKAGHDCWEAFRDHLGLTPRVALIITKASAVPDEKLELAFGGRLVRGSFPFVAGPGEAGKGMFFVFITACLTTGAPFPGEKKQRAPMNVLLCVTEDSKGRVKSRLRAAGADLDRAHFVEGPEVRRGGLTMASSMMLDDDAGALVRDAKQYDAGAFFLETAIEHFGDRAGKSRRSTNSEAEVRSALAPFRAICQMAGLYGLGLIHPRKSVEGGVEDSISGSAAFRNVPRGTLHIYKDPTDKTPDPVRLLFSSKANYLNRHPPTLRFRIRSWDEQLAGPCQCHTVNCGHEGRIVWEEPLVDERSDEDIWQQIATRGKPRRDVAVQEAEKFLRGLMQDKKIALTPEEIFKLAKEEGIGTSAVYSAKRNLGLVSEKSKEFHAGVVGWKEGEL